MKKVCFFTGKLGGYEACRRMLEMFEADPDFELHIIPADQHLYSEFGNSAKEIKVVPFSRIQDVMMDQEGDTSRDRIP